jgi:MoxR-like ATPase
MIEQAKINQTLAQLKGSSAGTIHTSEHIKQVARANGFTWNQIYEVLMRPEFNVGRGKYDLAQLFARLDGTVIPSTHSPAPAAAASSPAPIAPTVPSSTFQMSAGVQSVTSADAYVPEVDPTYVRWGAYDTVLRAVASELFFPLFISGLSGNGKTKMVEQCCAKLKREYIRVQISPETDEDDLIGGFRLIAGETVFCKGPVIKAMERGCLLLIDEIDRGSNKIMCLQGVLEGNPVLIKKTGQVIHPAKGFNVIATANTKGRGSDDGRFAAATIIDEAFLERFVATIEQPYAPKHTEKKIVLKHMEKFGRIDDDFATKLCDWSEVIRKTFEQDAIEEVISTRRLCHIVKSFAIFGDRMESIQLCISRFDSDTKAAFMDLYTKIDPSIVPAATPVAPVVESNVDGNLASPL